MSSRQPWSLASLLALQVAACNPDGAASTMSTSDTPTSDSTGATPTTDAPTTSTTPTTHEPTTSTTPTTDASTTSATPTTDGSTTTSTGSIGPQDTTDGATTGESSTGASSSTGGTGGSTGGLEPFSSFTCTELTPVELQLKEAISGSFTADGVPIDLLAVMVKGGATDFQVDIAGPVAPDDPYAADVAFWEQNLTAIGWDVNPPGHPPAIAATSSSPRARSSSPSSRSSTIESTKAAAMGSSSSNA